MSRLAAVLASRRARDARHPWLPRPTTAGEGAFWSLPALAGDWRTVGHGASDALSLTFPSCSTPSRRRNSSLGRLHGSSFFPPDARPAGSTSNSCRSSSPDRAGLRAGRREAAALRSFRTGGDRPRAPRPGRGGAGDRDRAAAPARPPRRPRRQTRRHRRRADRQGRRPAVPRIARLPACDGQPPHPPAAAAPPGATPADSRRIKDRRHPPGWSHEEFRSGPRACECGRVPLACAYYLGAAAAASCSHRHPAGAAFCTQVPGDLRTRERGVAIRLAPFRQLWGVAIRLAPFRD